MRTATAAVDAVEATGENIVALALAYDAVVKVADILGDIASRDEAGEENGRRRNGGSRSHGSLLGLS